VSILIVGIRADHRDGWGKYCAMLQRSLAQRASTRVILATNVKETGLSKEKSTFQIGSNNSLNVRKRELVRDVFLFARHWLAADTIIAADELSAPVCALAAKVFKKRLIMVVHGTYSVRSLECKRADLYRRAYLAADAIVSVSSYTKKRLVDRLPEVSEKIRVLPLAAVTVETERPAQSPAKNHFCIIGGIKPRKGVILAVKALELLLKKGLNVRLVVIGEQSHDDAYFLEVMELIAKLNIEDRITLTGFVSESEKNEIVASSIANLLPSENVGLSFEGFGFVHLEAGLFAVPTIGSKNCGNEDAIHNDETGYLLDQGDVEGLSECMESLTINSELRNRLGCAGQDFVFNWTWEDIAAAYENMLTAKQ
jgi:phosphatidyl-myo-inositol dimannoside synthase